MTRSVHRIRPPEAAVYTSLGSSVGLLVALTAMTAIINTEVRSIVLVGFGVSCGIMSLTMINRMLAYDRHVILAASVVFIDDPEPETPLQGQQLNVLTDNGVKWGVFLPPAHWAKLAGLALRNGNTFSKALCIKHGIKQAGIMNQELRGWHEVGASGQNATVWTDFCHYLEVQGLIKPVQRNQPNELTELGIAEFRKLARGDSPTPQRSERQNVTPTRYVTADFDDENEV